MSYKELSIEEWREIGKKAKEINRTQMDLLNLLSGKFPKSQYLDKWTSASKSFGKLRSHLDDIVCGKFKDLPDREVTSIFYGNDKN